MTTHVKMNRPTTGLHFDLVDDRAGFEDYSPRMFGHPDLLNFDIALINWHTDSPWPSEQRPKHRESSTLVMI